MLFTLLAVAVFLQTLRANRFPQKKFKEISKFVGGRSIIQSHANAFIISQCNNARYNYTVSNLEKAFPNFFNFICHRYPLLNDSRIHSSSDLVAKRVSSNLIAFADIWTYAIPNNSDYDSQWSFVFEDDVSVVEPSRWISHNQGLTSLNYTEILIDFMHDEEVRDEHGFFYLGICGPIFLKADRPITVYHDVIHHYKGYGSCAHATAITAKRARTFWADLASFRPNPDRAMDTSLYTFCVRSQTMYYTFGANIEMLNGTKHFGIIYQDSDKFNTTVW